MKKETISILGCGWYGLPLAKALLAEGYMVKGSTTTETKLAQLVKEGIQSYFVDLAIQKFDVDFFNCDILMVCIPPRKNKDSPINFVGQIETIGNLAKSQKIKNIIFISSTGIYNDGNFIVDENTIPKPESETGKSLLSAENTLTGNINFTTTIIRFGGLIGPDRNLAKHFAGKIDIANGLAPINLIHLSDCIGLTLAILQKRAFGILYHGVAPTHPTRADFYTQACIESGLAKPVFLHERLAWKQIESVKVPSMLQYTWKVLF